MQTQLALAIQLASSVHMDQFDKAGKPYILHPLHLMSQFLWDTELATIAVLHDIVEDSIVDFENLEFYGFTPRVIRAVYLLTHDSEDSYEEYIDKMCDNYDAIRVKRKDLEHNSDITRLKGIRPKDLERIEKYHKAFTKLGEAKSNFK